MDKPETEDVASAARLVCMQPSRLPPYVLAIVLTATTLALLIVTIRSFGRALETRRSESDRINLN